MFNEKYKESVFEQDAKRDNWAINQLFIDAGNYVRKNKDSIVIGRNLLLLALYLGYYGYAMSCNYGDEPSVRLTLLTACVLFYTIVHRLKNIEMCRRKWTSLRKNVCLMHKHGRLAKVIHWFFILAWSVVSVVYLIINVGLEHAENLRPLAGIAVFILLLVLLSNNRRKINWNCVFYGMILQGLFGLFIIKTTAGTRLMIWCSDRLTEFIRYADVGSEFVFGPKFIDHPIAMQTIPAVIVFIATIRVMDYFGVIKVIVKLIGIPMAYLLDVSAPEAINACANILLGGIESGSLIYEYLLTMPSSRLFAICAGGLSSVAGSSLVQYIAFGVPVKYLLAASAMSAPAALVCAKIVYPDTDVDLEDKKCEPEIQLHVTTHSESSDDNLTTKSGNQGFENKNSVKNEVNNKLDNIPTGEVKTETRTYVKKPKSFGEALILGTMDGLTLCASIIGLLIVSLAALELLNETVRWFGDRANIDISLNIILSYLFYPIVYLMGVDTQDCLRAGEFLGLRTLSTPGVPYIYVGKLIRNRERLANYIATLNISLEYDRTKDIFLPHWNETLTGGIFSERSELIVTYSLCGFATIPTMAMCLGIITTYIPHRINEITEVGVKLLITGTIASYLTACVAGLLT